MVGDDSLYFAAVAARGLSAAACKAAGVSRHSQKGDLRTRRCDGVTRVPKQGQRQNLKNRYDNADKNKCPRCCVCFQDPEIALNGELANLERSAPTLNGAPSAVTVLCAVRSLVTALWDRVRRSGAPVR
jgi:hypothetical protein